MMKITGLDALQKQFKEFERALKDLDGDIAKVSFDPSDPESIERAIQQVATVIDEKTAPYSRNQMVMSVAEQLKENAREHILERAARARIEPESSDDD